MICKKLYKIIIINTINYNKNIINYKHIHNKNYQQNNVNIIKKSNNINNKYQK